MSEKTSNKKLLCPKAGTATLSPVLTTASQSNMNIINVSSIESLGRINPSAKRRFLGFHMKGSVT